METARSKSNNKISEKRKIVEKKKKEHFRFWHSVSRRQLGWLATPALIDDRESSSFDMWLTCDWLLLCLSLFLLPTRAVPVGETPQSSRKVQLARWGLSHPTIVQLLSKSHPTIIKVSPNYRPTLIKISSNYHQSLTQLSSNSHPSVIQLSSNFHLTLSQLSSNSRLSLIQLSSNSHPTVIQVSSNSRTTLIQLSSNSYQNLIQLSSKSHPTLTKLSWNSEPFHCHNHWILHPVSLCKGIEGNTSNLDITITNYFFE